MEVEKILCTKLSINFTEDIIGCSTNQFYIDKLREKKQHTPIDGALIVDILRILRRSKLHIDNYIDNSEYVYLVYAANCVLYTDGDIIGNCEVIKINNTKSISGKIKYGEVLIREDDISDLFGFYKVGDIIPITILYANYARDIGQFQVRAAPYTIYPPEKNYIYALAADTTNIQDVDFYIDEANAIHDQINGLPAKEKANLLKFKNLIYPYKKQEKPIWLNKISGATITNFLDINYDNFAAPGIVICSPRINKCDPFIISIADNTKIANIEKILKNDKLSDWQIVHTSASVLFRRILSEHYRYMKFLLELSSSNQDYEINKNYWNKIKHNI